ncbi:TIGR02680 family protein [Streptomyces benahoarensis]|uniref:TIGR02680 family protein n=1 Tax=Streptomyces benahoarensis TaxID=2595054 RepID=A0A553ZSD5_9ACTN|nr:TIGR02680 family protein [Streptomyces benahoarensis]TSB32670.1 TIGR02680 family protein [Streptomyces benahoarensis]TSB44226.1 TIGR02680 family protein [Streptomyces benahoarensis]
MTTDARGLVPLPRSGPVTTAGTRFRLHRAGIQNVWQYDEQEFAFGDGRLLLRGKNGAGKSKALEMLLPYLLDGDSRALDATGTGRTTLAWLMLDGFEQTNRLGYLWVEFRGMTDGGDHRHLTLGAAICASKSTQKALPTFFVTPLRVGEDLHLVDGGKPLPVGRLKEIIGSDNITDRAVLHRSRVARELFGITDATRYRNLTQLLHRLRRPTVGDRIEHGGLASLLSETLPGLDEDVVEKVARNLHDLDAVRDELGRLERTDTALRTFLTSYRGYLSGVLRTSAQAVSRELEALAQRRRAAGDAAQRTSELRTQEEESEARLETLREEEEAARTDLAALHASHAYRSLRELSERRSTVEALRTAAVAAFTTLSNAHGAEEGAAGRLADGVEHLGSRLAELSTEHRELLAQAEKAGLPTGHLGEAAALPRTVRSQAVETGLTDPDGETHTVQQPSVVRVDTGAVQDGLLSWQGQLEDAETVVKNRARMVQEVTRLTTRAEEARSRAVQADTERERLEGETEEAVGRLDAGREKVAEESGVYACRVAEWVSRTRTAVGSDCPPLDAVHTTVACESSAGAPFADRTLPPDIDSQAWQAAHAALEPYGEELTECRDALALAVGRLGEELDRLAGEKRDWERRTDPEPPVPYHRVAERAPGSGAPFYRLVDFTDGLAPTDRAGLEAALEASGILDAWVGADGALVDPGTRDTLLCPGPALPDAPTLASALRPAPQPGCGVMSEQVEHLLAAIALAPAQETTAHDAVYYDGSWCLGILSGRHHKSDAEYVGAAVRAETRRRILAELAERLTQTEQRLADARHELAEADARRRALRLAEQDFPRARVLADAWSRAESDEKTLRDLTAKANRAARLAEEARALAVAARAEADATATAHDLPSDPVELARVRTALAALLTGIGHLRRAVGSTGERLGAHHADAERYERAWKDRLAAEENYRLRLTGLRTAQQDLSTREEAIGATEEEILLREQKARQRIAHAAQSLPAAQRTRNDLRDLRVRAEEKEKRLREDLADQEAAVIGTGGALRGALGRPEVVRGAGMDRSALPEDVADDPGSDVRGRLRALRALADAVQQALGRPNGEVSDSTLLNRHTELRDHLAGGFDAQLEERDGIKVCRLIDDRGSHDVAAVGERIAVQAAEARGRLTEREREVFQRFLTGELGDHLSAQVITAANLVAALNENLRTVRTSHGLGVELLWKLDEDVDADVRAAVELLRSPSSLRTREQTEQLREVLQRRIEDARRADPSAGYAAHLRTALDYRDWFRFHTFVVEDAAPGRRRKLTGRTGLSQGEQRVLSYLVLFAAAAAHFTSLAESAPHTPRLILLDDAFAKVDEPTHGRLGRILVDLDLDFVLTSERLMGNWPEVPSLHIYECLRDPHVRGVATLHYTWNGRHRRLVSV